MDQLTEKKLITCCFQNINDQNEIIADLRDKYSRFKLIYDAEITVTPLLSLDYVIKLTLANITENNILWCFSYNKISIESTCYLTISTIYSPKYISKNTNATTIEYNIPTGKIIIEKLNLELIVKIIVYK